MSNSSAMGRWIKRHIEGLRRRLLRVAVLMLSANPHPVARVLGVADGTV
jgi:hypothetical protein